MVVVASVAVWLGGNSQPENRVNEELRTCFFSYAPSKVFVCVCVFVFLWCVESLVQCVAYDQSEELLFLATGRLKRVTKEKSSDLCERIKDNASILLRKCLASLTSQTVYSLLSHLRKSFQTQQCGELSLKKNKGNRTQRKFAKRIMEYLFSCEHILEAIVSVLY